MRFRKNHIALLIGVAVILTVGTIIADTLTKPMLVQLRSHIQVCRRTAGGTWEVIDEIGPAPLQFEASLLELATDRKIESEFKWTTRSKKGVPYSVRLLEPAQITYSPTSGEFTAQVRFEVTWGEHTVVVPANLTTGSVQTPLGARNGKRASGLLGVKPMSLTVVSVNDLTVPGESAPLKLVCTEEYTLIPRG